MSDAEPKFPFARELEEQHDALRAAVRWFETELGSGRSEGRSGARAAREFLVPFREQLVGHFRFEERGGLASGFGSDDQGVRSWTQELVRQHHELEQRLDALLVHPGQDGGSAGRDAWQAELLAFLGALRRHDAEENSLMLWISRGPDLAPVPEAP